MGFFYALNHIAMDLDNLIKALYWLAMIGWVGWYGSRKLKEIAESLASIAESLRKTAERKH